MGELIVETPGSLCGFALAERLAGFGAQLEVSGAEVSPVRVRFAERDLGALLSAIERWLRDYSVDAVDLVLDGQVYKLAARLPSVIRPRPLSELPAELVFDA